MSTTFNIIYVPGTVRILLPLVHTLLEHAPVRLRLIDNGCLPEESILIRNVCSLDDRLSFYALPFKGMVEHGHALNHLFEMDEEDIFAFMDSDIFATGPWLDTLLDELETHAGCCSCMPIWHRPDDAEMPSDYNIMGGRYVRTTDGHFLGVTYLAMYRRGAVRRGMDKSRKTFGRPYC